MGRLHAQHGRNRIDPNPLGLEGLPGHLRDRPGLKGDLKVPAIEDAAAKVQGNYWQRFEEQEQEKEKKSE